MDYKKILQEERQRLREELLSSSAGSNFSYHSNKKEERIANIQTMKSNGLKNRKDEISLLATDTIDETYKNVLLNVPENFNIDDYKIGNFEDLYYVPDIISEGEENELAALIERAGAQDSERWKQLRNRRLQCWGKFPISADRMSEELLDENEEFIPAWLENIIDELVAHRIFKEQFRPNNILVNQYRPLEGILHHTDGPIYYDRVAIVSLQSDCLMTFRRNLASSEIGEKFSGDLFSVLLRRRSLLVFTRAVYSDHMHGIETGRDTQIVGENGCECINKEVVNVTDGDMVRFCEC